MSAPRLDRGPPVVVNLFFDGSVAPNPGPGAWGAVAIFKINKRTTTLQWSAPVGDTTSYVAEYLGLIGGLRRVINYLQSQSIRYSYVRLRIHGDSALVILQVTGKEPVTTDLLEPLHRVAVHTLSRFLDVGFDICSNEQNATADRLAHQARRQNFTSENKAIFYPALTNFADAWVEGVHTLASHDVGTESTDPTCFIDGSFLYNLPDGPVLFRHLRDPHPLSIAVGKVRMTVLGTISLDIAVRFSRRRNGQPFSKPDGSKMVDVVVMHSLPVPIHVSHRNPQIGKPDDRDMTGLVKFAGENLPEPFLEHHYWHSDHAFLGIEDPSAVQSRGVRSARQLQGAGQLDEDAIASLSLR